MPAFKVYSLQEKAQVELRGTRPDRPAIDLSAYIEFLETAEPNYPYAVEPEEGENRRTIKRRLTRTAKQLGKNLVYKRRPNDILAVIVKG